MGLQAQSRLSVGRGLGPGTSFTDGGGAAPTYRTDAQAYFNALAAEAVFPTLGQKAAINDWFQAGDDDGWLPLLTFAGMPLWANAEANRINLLAPGAVVSEFSTGTGHGIGGVVSGGGEGGGQGVWDSAEVMPGDWETDGFFWSVHFPDIYSRIGSLFILGGTSENGGTDTQFSAIIEEDYLTTDYPIVGASYRTAWPAGSVQDLIAYQVSYNVGGPQFDATLYQMTLGGTHVWDQLTATSGAAITPPGFTVGKTPTFTQYLGGRNDNNTGPGAAYAMEIAWTWWCFGKALTTIQLDSYGSATASMLEACGAGVPFWVAETEGDGAFLSETGNTLILN